MNSNGWLRHRGLRIVLALALALGLTAWLGTSPAYAGGKDKKESSKSYKGKSGKYDDDDDKHHGKGRDDDDKHHGKDRDDDDKHHGKDRDDDDDHHGDRDDDDRECKRDDHDDDDGDSGPDGQCTLTQGYWKNHNKYAKNPSQKIPWPISEDTNLCGKTWLENLKTSPKGDAFYILSHQWIAARLNQATGAPVPPAVAGALADGAALMADCKIKSDERDEATTLAGVLGGYNEGKAGVPHCGDRPKPSVPLCASAAQGGGHALWLPGVGTEFIFTAPGPFIEKGDGTAQLSGVVVDANDTNRRFTVKLDFGGRVNPGDAGYPPAGSPKKELPASQYAPVGPVNPNTWHYYTTLTGALAGDRDLEGALYTVARRGPAFQVGVGANGKNVLNGASGWFTATLVQQPYVGDALPGTVHGDVNVDLSAECEYCVQGALLDGALNQAFWLPGISEYFLFVPPGTFVEHADGTAELDGVIIDVSDPTLTRRFAVHVVFSGRVNPGEAGYPPPDSPHTGLLETGDLVPAGPVDTDSWHYYTVIQGTLTGLGAFDGAVLTFDRRGPAYQVGPGGSGFNHDFGSGGWITLDVISQPTSGDPLPDGVEGDINLDHDVECVPEGGTG